MSPAWVGLIALAFSPPFDEIAVRPARTDQPNTVWSRSVHGLDKPGERTIETLKRFDLADRYRQDPEVALNKLELHARRGPDPDLVYALAELSYLEGKKGEARRILARKPKASPIDRYLDAVAYAHDFLFDPALSAGRSPTDPRFRMAMDLYNGALDRLIRAAQAHGPKGKVLPGGAIPLKINDREMALRVELGSSPWQPTDIDELVLASDFEITGLDSRSRAVYGLGVPLIAIRRSHEGQAHRSRDEHFLPSVVAFPLTAFLCPTSKLREAGEDVEATRDCTLQLLDPVRVRAVGDPSSPLALETDLTTPLAYMWSQTDMNKYRWKGLLRPGEASDRAGLMLLRPFEADKVPVVMVHGLMSSPLAWVPMVNELLRDPQINQRYQFFLYMYPTGVPIPIAAAGLRDSLLEAEKTFETPQNRQTFRQMVLLGHSMGGLLSHAMAVNSGNQFWALYSDRQFQDMTGPADVLAEIKHYTFFEPVPCVRRVVFLATPHRGSDLARSVVGKVGSNLIGDVDRHTELLNRLIKENPDSFDRRRFRRMPTSIETLEPPGREANVLSALLAMEPAPDVTFHSIIGSNRPGPVDTTTDGVVPYRSARFDGVKSELVVRSNHGVQRDPEAILEVRRVLREHIGSEPPPPARIAREQPQSRR
jgi:triacylglycerol esterase/lipase EstA (alpha/beta hydrolase family)